MASENSTGKHAQSGEDAATGTPRAPRNPRRQAVQVPEEHTTSTSAEPTAQAVQWVKEEQRHREQLRAAGVDDGDRETEWVYQAVVQANPLAPGSPVDPGPDTGALQAALNAGYRPTGNPRLSGPEGHADGVSQVWTWTVPVIKVKAEIDPDKPVEKDADPDTDPTKPGREVTG